MGLSTATVVIIVRPACAEVQWLERVEVRSNIECPRSGTARPVAELYPLLIAGSDRFDTLRVSVDMGRLCFLVFLTDVPRWEAV